MKYLKFGAKLAILVILLGAALVIRSTAFAAGPTGATPNDPLMVPTSAQTIAPNTTLWFYFDYGLTANTRGKPRAQVTLNASGVSGIQFAVYTRDQANNWMSDANTTPVGRGTLYYDIMTDTFTNDLYWSGGFNTSDRYFVAVSNTSATPIRYTLTITGDAVSLYPPVLPTPTPTLWVPITLTPIPTTTLSGKIVFETTSAGIIYTVNGDGSNLKAVSRGIDPSWSPDGKQITFARWDNTGPGVYIANADGTNEQLLYQMPRVRSPRWSPDGKYIVFTEDKSKSDNQPIWKLGIVEVATGKLNEPQCTTLCYSPTWGSDSTTIIYTDPAFGVLTTSILGGPATRILGPSGYYWDANFNILRPILGLPQIQGLDSSPDGKRIAYAQQAHDRWELSVMNSDGTYPTGITTADPILSILFDKVVHNTAPTWSPDGKQIMFLSDRNGKWEFFVADPNGQNIRQVLKNVTDSVTIKFNFENERQMDWVQ
jgi:Tol biopolymer transport system component